jgi:hypothetical protein
VDYQHGIHSTEKMVLQGITDAEIQAVLDDPTTTERQVGAKVVYTRVIDGWPIRVVLAHDVTPPKVVTVMIVWFGGPYHVRHVRR